MAFIYNFTDTWNNGLTTYAAVKCDVTDTASAADSALINMLVGGTSMFRVQKDGEISTSHYYSATQKWAKGSDIASASALTVPSNGNFFDVTGTTTVTSISAVQVGTRILLQFDGALTLTHHATDLKLPGGANITTAAGDIAEFVEYATGDWHCVSYTKASGAYLSNVVDDTTPQLGGNLDVNGAGIAFPGATVTDVTGSDTLLVSGTAGTSGNLAMWNADGDLVDGSVVAANVLVSGNIGSTVQAYDAGLASIAGLTTAADRMIYTTGSDTYAVATLTSAARSILDDASVSDIRTTLGLAIGSDVQAYSANIATTAASQAEMEAGTESALRSMSPLRVAQAIAALASGGGGGLQSVQVFTTSGTWTRPSGITKVLMFVTGGGGGGGGYTTTNTDSGGGGGGAGGTAIKFLDVTSIASSTITIGSGGSAGSGNGGNGGNSSWADGTNTITGSLGSGGSAGASTAAGAGGSNGSASGGDLNTPGGDGNPGGCPEDGTVNGNGGSGGSSFWAGGGAGRLGGGSGGSGSAGDGYGSGGGGGGGSTGGAGKAGVVLVLEFA